MQLNQKKVDLKVKMMLLTNYLTYGDFEMSKALLLQILDEDKESIRVLLEGIIKKAAQSLLYYDLNPLHNKTSPDIGNTIQDPIFTNKLYLLAVNIIQEHFPYSFSNEQIERIKSLLSFDAIMISLMNKISNPDFNYRAFYDIRNMLLQKEKAIDTFSLKTHEEYDGAINSLKYVLLYYLDESKKIYEIINDHQRETKENFPIEYVFTALKDVIWQSLQEKNLDIVYNYLPLLSGNNIFEKGDFRSKLYDEIVKSLYNQSDVSKEKLLNESLEMLRGPKTSESTTSSNAPNFEIMQTLEALLKDHTLKALNEFEKHIEKSLFISKNSTLKDLMKILRPAQDDNPLSFWERLIIYSMINLKNPVFVILEIATKSFSEKKFENITYIIRSMPTIKDLILLIIKNNISVDDIENFYNLLKKVKKDLPQEELPPQPLVINKSLKKLEEISQDIQFQVYMLRWFYKFAYKTSRIRNISFSQFCKMNQRAFSESLSFETFDSHQIMLFIEKIKKYAFPPNNQNLVNKARKIINLFRILLIKENLLEEVRIQAMIQNDRPHYLASDTLEMIDNLIEDISSQPDIDDIHEELSQLGETLKELFFVKFGDLQFIDLSTIRSYMLRNLFVLSPSVLVDLTERLNRINKIFHEKKRKNKELEEFLKYWQLRTRIYQQLSEQIFLVHDPYPLSKRGYDSNNEIDYVEHEKIKTLQRVNFSDASIKKLLESDHLEIFFDEEDKLLKYLVLMQDTNLLDTYFELFNINNQTKAFQDFFNRREKQSNERYEEIEITANTETEFVDTFILKNIEGKWDTNVSELPSKISSIVDSTLFQKFPWLHTDDKNKQKELKDNSEQASLQFNKELSLSFVEDMEKLFADRISSPAARKSSKSFEDRLRDCLKTLQQYRGTYRYLFNFISYIEKLHNILKQSLSENEVKSNGVALSSEDWCYKLFFELKSEQFIKFVSSIPGVGLNTSLILSKKLEIDFISSLLADIGSVGNIESNENIITKANWVFKQEALGDLTFFNFTNVPFFSILLFFKYKNDQALLPSFLVLLQEAEKTCEQKGNYILARFFSSIYQKSLKYSNRRLQTTKRPSFDEDSFLKNSIRMSTSESYDRKRKIDNPRGMLPLLLIDEEIGRQGNGKDKIINNVMSTTTFDKTFSDIETCHLLSELRLEDEIMNPSLASTLNREIPFLLPPASSYIGEELKPNIEKKEFESKLYSLTTKEDILTYYDSRKLSLNPWEKEIFSDFLLQNSSLFSTTEIRALLKELQLRDLSSPIDIHFDYPNPSEGDRVLEDTTINMNQSTKDTDEESLWERLINNKSDIDLSMSIISEDLSQRFIQKKLKVGIYEIVSTVQGGAVNKRTLWNLREKLATLDRVQTQAGELIDKSILETLYLTMDLLEICVNNNISTSFKLKDIEDMNTFNRRIKRRIFNNSKMNELVALLRKKNLSTLEVYLWKWESQIRQSQFKESRKLADSLFEQAAIHGTQTALLDHIIAYLQKSSYEGTIDYIVHIQKNMILKECSIKPLFMVERKIKEELSNYKAAIENECLYYLNSYATPERQAQFYESKNQYEQLLRIIMSQGVSKQLFINELIPSIYEKNKLQELREWMLKLDPELTSFIEYLKLIIGFLMEKNAQKELHHFQIMIGDYFSAGEYCLEQFYSSKTFKEKLKFLDEAGKHFRMFIEVSFQKLGINIKKPAFIKLGNRTEDEAENILRKIRVQKNILEEFPEIVEYHVFGDIEDISRICELILLNNPKLAIDILTNLKIALKDFLVNILSKFAYEKRLNSIEEVLQTLAELKKKNLIPESQKLTDTEVYKKYNQ